MDELGRMKQHGDVQWHYVWWPLITEMRLYKETIRDKLDSMNIPYMLSSECDGCPHKNPVRWRRTSKETLEELARLEAGLGGTQFFTSKRIPLLDSIHEMENSQPTEYLFDGCEMGYCFN